MKQFFTLAFCLCLSASLFAQKGGGDGPQTYQPTSNTYQKVGIQLWGTINADAVKAAIQERISWLGEQGFDLDLEYEKESPHALHYTYFQTWQGIPLYHQNIKANAGQNGKIFSFLNNLLPGMPQAEGTFAKSETEAVAVLVQQYLLTEEEMNAEVEKRYFPQNGVLIPAYQVHYNYGESRWESVLNANNLHTLTRRDLAAYRAPLMTGTDTSGTALVFNPDPLTTSGNAYNSSVNWSDNNDADNTDLNNQRVSVVLQDICFDNGLFTLVGPHVDLQDLENPTSPVPTSANGDFSFTRNQQGFEDVMCYYHLDTFQRYIQSLGYTNIYNSPLLCDPHGLNGSDQSHFVPQGASSRIAFGEGCVDDAEDADVIIHEYGHALSWSAAPNSNGGTERNGLDEGWGDYFATSYSRAISYTFWKNMFTWDGHNDCWDGRTASTNELYPPSSSFDIYAYGTIWNTCLMEVWGQIGREASDKVAFQSLYGSNLNMSLSDAALVVLDADSLVYGGAHTFEYQQAFCNRNLLTGTACIVSTPEPLANSVEWNLYPNPTQEQVNIQLVNVSNRNGYQYRITSMLGQVMEEGTLSQTNTEVPIPGFASGFYLVNILKDGQVVGSRKLSVQ